MFKYVLSAAWLQNLQSILVSSSPLVQPEILARGEVAM
jgi:hypothetical protein